MVCEKCFKSKISLKHFSNTILTYKFVDKSIKVSLKLLLMLSGHLLPLT